MQKPKNYFVAINDSYKCLRSNKQGYKQYEPSYEKKKNKKLKMNSRKKSTRKNLLAIFS
jgi:hypothetical protein